MLTRIRCGIFRQLSQCLTCAGTKEGFLVLPGPLCIPNTSFLRERTKLRDCGTTPLNLTILLQVILLMINALGLFIIQASPSHRKRKPNPQNPKRINKKLARMRARKTRKRRRKHQNKTKSNQLNKNWRQQ